jgi:hypothetical protein
MPARLLIASDFRGTPLPVAEQAWFELSWQGADLQVAVDAPFYADPPPPCAAGTTDRLWEYEVVELFVAGADERYLEVELGPYGHQLVLMLEGVRCVRQQGLPIAYRAVIERGPDLAGPGPIGRYRGFARVPGAYLPPSPARVNAYMIHGVGEGRRFCAHAPVPGLAPDFHRLDRFVPWPAAL